MSFVSQYNLLVIAATLISRSVDTLWMLLSAACMLLLLHHSCHWLTFAIIYELTMLVMLPVFTITSRSYRRTHALFTLLLLAIISTCLLYCWLSVDSVMRSGSIVDYHHIYEDTVIMLCLLATKVPTYPFVF